MYFLEKAPNPYPAFMQGIGDEIFRWRFGDSGQHNPNNVSEKALYRRGVRSVLPKKFERAGGGKKSFFSSIPLRSPQSLFSQKDASGRDGVLENFSLTFRGNRVSCVLSGGEDTCKSAPKRALHRTPVGVHQAPKTRPTRLRSLRFPRRNPGGRKAPKRWRGRRGGKPQKGRQS
jgi:hypothetical protein